MTKQFLNSPPRFLFFTGKGGVGKTSIACATAIELAEAGKKILLVSTDPASNLGQVFGLNIGNTITTIPAVSNLSALEIDPQAAAQLYRNRIVDPVRGKLPDSAVEGIEEQLSGACTTEIAAFDEFTALLINSTLTANYDHVIFDTAPTGHTIRLFQLPGAWSDFLEEGKGNASCLGPLAGLEKQRNQYREAVEALANPERTRLILVARAQASSLREAARTHDELAGIGLSQQYLVINGVLPQSEFAKDSLERAVYAREQKVIAEISEALKALPTDIISLKPFNLVGLDALHLLLKDQSVVSDTSELKSIALNAPNLSTLVDEIAKDGHGLVMTMGKGGVGKTTIAAAIAVELAHRGLSVHLTTSDPAAHINETLNGAIDNLTVSRIDPHAEIERYKQHVMDTKGKGLDDAGRKLLEEDLRSPCTEEIAVFQAFSRIIREAGKKFIVMDTAPTGHTLLLLDATGSYHRDIERQMGKTNKYFRTPMMQLQDPKQTKVLLITLAETTPVLEVSNLQADLRRAGIEPWAWVINNSVAASNPRSPLLRKRAQNELREIDLVANIYAIRYAVVPLFKDEPIGIEKLLEITRHQQ